MFQNLMKAVCTKFKDRADNCLKRTCCYILY